MRPHRRARWALAAAAIWVPGLALGAPSVLLAQSEIGFVSHQMGVPVAGTFAKFDAQVQLDAAAPEKGRFEVNVDLASVQLPTRDAMAEVLKPGWFDTARFPRASFSSTAIRHSGHGNYEIGGRLTIKGHARDIVVPVRVEQAGERTTATGEVTVPRLAFAIGDGEWADPSLVADEVQIRFRLVMAGVERLRE
jgi:polyisoprenoid-binding protein YceI